MTISSHRLKIEEKKVYRKLVFSLVVFCLFIVLVIFAGIPILTKTIVFLTSFRKENILTNTNADIKLEAPVLDPLDAATNSATISVSGYGEVESAVKIYLNDIEAAKVLVDKDSRFTAKNLKLTEGTNNITGITLKADLESSPSAALVIIYKKNPPKLDISSPSENQIFIAENKEITISGETDPGNKVTINDRFVILNQDGKFNYKTALSDGENRFKIAATDIAGNQTIIERKVTYSP